MTEVQVLEGALEAFRTAGFKPGHYMPDPTNSRARYCAIGGLIKAAGGVALDCHVYREGEPFQTATENRNRALFLAAHPEVVRAHARLEAHLGKTKEELAALAGDDIGEDAWAFYGGSLLEFWVEECVPADEEVVALFRRALVEARRDEETRQRASFRQPEQEAIA